MDASRGSFSQDQVLNVDSDAALIQRGDFPKVSAYGDISLTSAHTRFVGAVNTALKFSGQRSRRDELVDSRDQQFLLTKSEFSLLQTRARSISNYSKIPYDTCEDFLIILCFVDNIADLTRIADAIQLADIADPTMVRNPTAILNIRGLERVAFVASALDALINTYRRFFVAAQNVNNRSDNDDVQSVLDTISSLVGGFGGSSIRLDMAGAENSIGSLMSELVLGKRIPMTVIAKNPILQSPSYAGKAFFGESPTALSNVDINQIFNKKIAAFSQNSAGFGTTAFTLQNFGSISSQTSLSGLVSKILTGSSSVGSTRKQNMVNNFVSQINTFTGSKPDETVEITRADNAIPIMMGLSTALSGLDKCAFSGTTFQQGWSLANSVMNQLQVSNPGFLEMSRKLL